MVSTHPGCLAPESTLGLGCSSGSSCLRQVFLTCCRLSHMRRCSRLWAPALHARVPAGTCCGSAVAGAGGNFRCEAGCCMEALVTAYSSEPAGTCSYHSPPPLQLVSMVHLLWTPWSCCCPWCSCCCRASACPSARSRRLRRSSASPRRAVEPSRASAHRRLSSTMVA